ncbi:MAG: type II toxin-antitoxin system Phd/YefM family antitoxin [bacterium]
MASIRTVPAVEARTHLGDIMKRSFKTGERVIVEKSGIPMIVILSAEEYTRLIQEREERFKIFDQIRAKAPNIPSEEVDKDISKAIIAVRKKRV